MQAGISHELLDLEKASSGEAGEVPADAGTATDSDDSLVPYDLTEGTEEGMLFLKARF